MATENVKSVRSEDPEMFAAIKEARDSFRKFLDAFVAPKEKQSAFLVKIAFTKDETVEHIWLADLNLNGPKPSGVIANPPLRKDLKFKQRVEIDFTYLSDWMFIEDGILIGGFTTRLLRKRMTPDERRKNDEASPYRFQ
ncbi:YegJ family protein [Horticoccus sp. 23ND18S-11]|uniref:YegJ family protein n=1 Tax=Horticoccus sp. 23ND18S-11 TaxID=3391832 RepID=UPI0039C979EF